MKNIKMKLIMISFCVSVIFITNVKALSIEDFNNSETVKTTASSTITREEYLKLKENYSDLMIDTFTQDSIDVILKDNSNYVEEYIVTTTYADYFGNIISTQEENITKDEMEAIISEGDYQVRRDVLPYTWKVDYTTTYKHLLMTINKNSDLYIVSIYNDWLKMPQVKKYDVIASRWEGNAIYSGGIEGLQNVKLKDGKTNFTMYNLDAGLDHIVFDNKGVGISMNLYDNATEIVNSMSYHLSNASKNKIVGTYQHASNNTITLEESTSYKITANGLGGCISFKTTAINNKYDGMKGIYYNLP
ncbi:MAG: hypothetical protein SOZ04_05495 [Bacilli bacterium]|nr:hypothetical protein [Bacilli bacterium]